jgi:hypothetical protein
LPFSYQSTHGDLYLAIIMVWYGGPYQAFIIVLYGGLYLATTMGWNGGPYLPVTIGMYGGLYLAIQWAGTEGHNKPS